MKVGTAIKLVVGLGNPGVQYEKTRHNVGFWLVSALAEKYRATFKREKKFKGFVSVSKIAGCECRLLMPTTFMNLSGEAVRNIASFYKIPTQLILVVHDEMDFLPGIVRLKKNGGANGHNGVQNIIGHLDSNDFWRLRVGIGKPACKEDAANYVLNSPSPPEIKQINEAIYQAMEIIPDLLVGEFGKAMQDLHS